MDGFNAGQLQSKKYWYNPIVILKMFLLQFISIDKTIKFEMRKLRLFIFVNLLQKKTPKHCIKIRKDNADIFCSNFDLPCCPGE